MKAAALVLVFWASIGLIVAWAFGIAASVDAELWLPAGVLIALPALGLSVFMWIAFRETL